MHAHGVKVLNTADNDAVVVAISHDFEFVLFPTGDRTLNENFPNGRRGDSLTGQNHQLFGIGRDSRAGATQDVARANDDRIANLLGNDYGFGHRVSKARLGNLEANVGHGRFELLAVFGGSNRFGFGTNDFDTELLEHTTTNQFHRQVQRRLTTKGWQQCVRTFLANDVGHHVGVQRFDVGDIGRRGVGHDRGRVGVDQDDLVALLAQHLAGLGARVVELTGLANNDWPRPDDENG